MLEILHFISNHYQTVLLNQHPLLQPTIVLHLRLLKDHGPPVRQYLIQWEGQPTTKVTWETESNLR